MAIEFVLDKIEGGYRPTLYPGEKQDDLELPDSISNDHNRLNSIIETKYSREFLKICAFYNKFFPSLKASEWSQSSYNTQPFTAMNQERNDTGTGINFNYLKQIVDQVTSRLGTIAFTPKLISEDQSFEFIVYKDEVERILRTFMRNDDFNRQCLEAFHHASIVGYSHAFIDPYTGDLISANDYEIGMFESQFNKNEIVQMLYRDYAFPVSSALKYLVDCTPEQKAEIIESLSSRASIDFKMYIHAGKHKVYVTIGNKTLPAHDYPFDRVLVTTFQWDVGCTRSHTTSLFDLLYPLQREINRIAAKLQQMIRMYKGPVPVFNSDVDIAMKAISNGAGEALYLDSARSTAELMTVINPTPLDPQLSAEITNYKTAMYELAGIQNASFDMENMRSAAAVIALDQTRDSVFQAQLSAMAQFIKESMMLYVEYFSAYPEKSVDRASVDWESIFLLMKKSYINLQPVHLNDPLSDEEQAEQHNVDYNALAISRVTLDIIKGKTNYYNIPYFIDKHQLVINIALALIKFEALGVFIPITLHKFLMDAFINNIASGEIIV